MRRPPGVRPGSSAPWSTPGSDRPRPASALLNSDPRALKTSQAQMRWRQVTTQERPWRMKRCSSRSTSRGRKGSLETGLKLGTVSTRVQARAELFGNEAVTAGCQRALPDFSPCFPGEVVGFGFLFRKGQLPQGSFPVGPPAGSGGRPGRAAGKLNPVLGKAGDSGPVLSLALSRLRCDVFQREMRLSPDIHGTGLAACFRRLRV